MGLGLGTTRRDLGQRRDDLCPGHKKASILRKLELQLHPRREHQGLRGGMIMGTVKTGE